jgi:hypothetical protein
MNDANLVLMDGTLDCTYANVVTAGYGTPTSTTRNAGGFAVIDLGVGGGPVTGLAAILELTEAAGGAGDEMTAIIEESTTEAFTVPHEIMKFDILAATKGVILGSEAPATVVKRITPTMRYLRLKMTVSAGDDFKTVYCNVSPFPFKVT